MGAAGADNTASQQEPIKTGTTANIKRRALGDITNAFVPEDVKESGKLIKPSILPSESESKLDAEEELIGETVSERVYMQRPSDDIDARDSGNPVLATNYVNEMYENFNVLEKEVKVNPSYMTNQPYVNERMRAILVDWLVGTSGSMHR